MMNKLLKNVVSCGVIAWMVASCTSNVPVAKGDFNPDWESLKAWECPEWFKDAKFGIWAHWGPQCQAETGDWYARHMYYEKDWQGQHHRRVYGDPGEYGLKELIRDWKAEEWNPDALVKLYKSVGARYFFTLGQHHDNFDLWASPYQEWNSVNVGPKKDIIKGWADACKKYGLPLGISMHGSHTWTWMEGSQAYDGNLTKADGKDEKEMAILEGIKEWMDVNGASIYGTRPWKTFGEGPMAEAANPLNAQGFNENNNYSSADIRFVQRNDTVFTTIMRWPQDKEVLIKSFGATSPYYNGEVKSVGLLGHGILPFTNGQDGLTVTLPAEPTNKIAPVLVVTF